MGFEHESCQAVIIKIANKVLWVLTTKPLLEAKKCNTKAIFKKDRTAALSKKYLRLPQAEAPGLGIFFLTETSKVIALSEWLLLLNSSHPIIVKCAQFKVAMID